MLILGIESSCDETAAAVVQDGTRLCSNVVNSQIDIHSQYGGVVPEVAARSHLEVVMPVVNKALSDADVTWDNIDAIAVTYAPGLSGSLLIGTLAAKTLAYLHNKPLYPIHHVEAHVYANFITQQADSLNLTLPTKQPTFPMLALIVSGGHSQLVLFRDHGDYTLLGQTQDDAIGEAFDKVAKMLGLPYPGGPSISRAAEQGDAHKYDFPKAKLAGMYDFSFSGLKTAVLRRLQREVGVDFTFPSHELPVRVDEQMRHDFAASFQHIAIETLVDKARRAYDEYQPASVVIAGGVAANQELRRQLSAALPLDIEYAPIQLCTDNAAMIATLGYYQSKRVEPTSPFALEIRPSLSMVQENVV
ncbi:tRNA (adenosine(37)-N6)-threonylcarbamoyltransferase complex transferase subunit TsaD [Candidatus Mycosynbacter amalyticus]|uniref:tRNA N6-adenosine threonylcarbamoyltransferase n=1 Tax=Candidatus Mycosynbacter amalyticus TaxID=2665156 RepID=A0A857MS62_9BACT|nr:tRNA (adenosine(37)-N6)-threonylcarbamoyltransferase complex transferase subunit TsaD [Candidatus Mycosynbacter amalyticus]QHN42297.1 tRNA (adenosine(37)-N6)-threonylcarbamoyltransferase complex transferase subunit TsaD [Candidatus Mycosynbacter amalyticus]